MYRTLAHVPGGQPIGGLDRGFAKLFLGIRVNARRELIGTRRERVGATRQYRGERHVAEFRGVGGARERGAARAPALAALGAEGSRLQVPEEARARDAIHQLQERADLEGRKREQQQERRHELRPHKKRQTHPRQPLRAQLHDRHDEVDRAEQR